VADVKNRAKPIDYHYPSADCLGDLLACQKKLMASALVALLSCNLCQALPTTMDN
jgi:hypothetical protein